MQHLSGNYSVNIKCGERPLNKNKKAYYQKKNILKLRDFKFEHIFEHRAKRKFRKGNEIKNDVLKK